MKRHKAPGMSGLVAEMIQSTGDRRTHWILDLCNGICERGLYSRRLEVKYDIINLQREGDPMECGSYRGIKLLEHAMKV